MPTTTVPVKSKDVITPMLVNNIPASYGHYQTTLTWEIDSTTLQPVAVRHEVTLGPASPEIVE